jgi:hypothetical protein
MKQQMPRLQSALAAVATMLFFHAGFAADQPSGSDRTAVGGQPTDTGTREKVSEPGDIRKPAAALDELLRAFESGNTDEVRQKLDPSLIGYSKLLDDIAREQNECKQLRVHLLNTSVQANAGFAVIETSWEKRCLMLPHLAPRLTTGRSSLTFKQGAGGWILFGISPGNMLARTPSPTVSPTPVVITPAAQSPVAPAIPAGMGGPAKSAARSSQNTAKP